MNTKKLEYFENILNKDDKKCKLKVIDKNISIKVKFKNQNFLFLCCYVNNHDNIKIKDYLNLILYYNRNFINFSKKYITALFLINEKLDIISYSPLEKMNDYHSINKLKLQTENSKDEVKIYYDLNEILNHGFNFVDNENLKSFPMSKLFHFKSEFLSYFLTNNQKVKIKFKNDIFQYRNFENIFLNKNYKKITNVISSLHNNELNNIFKKSKQLVIPKLPNIRKYIPQKEISNSNLKIKNLDMYDIQNLKDRASYLHKRTLNILDKYLRKKKLIVYEDPKSFDMFAYNDDYGYIYEAKSITSKNIISQIRSAITQLSFYIFFHQQIGSSGFDRVIKKYLIFHENPIKYDKLNNLNLYFKFLNYLGIRYIWIDDGKVVNHD